MLQTLAERGADMLSGLISSGRIIDIMLVALVLEVVVLQIYRRRTGDGIALVPLLVNLGAGGSLMLALRAALTNADWRWVGALLTLALLFHVADQFQRWERAAPDDARRDPPSPLAH